MPVTSAMSRRTKTKTPTIQPAHSRTEGVTTLRSSSMVWRVKRPMAMNGLVIVFIPETMRRAGMESPSPAREQQGRGYGESPLHARGRAGPWPNACSPARNHPCMRGEECTDGRRAGVCLESPPHARGRAAIAEDDGLLAGITPACAGKSTLADRCSPRRLESPPHARGRGVGPAGRADQDGITPACAGKRARHHCKRHTGRESPPHARGRAVGHLPVALEVGITPTCAGKRRETFSKPLSVRNHPRMRGEESNENAASEDMAIPPKCKFLALFQELPPSAA